MAKSGDPRADFQPLSADVDRQQPGTPQSYEETVAQLDRALQSLRGNLDADTARTLDDEIATVDRAIDEGRRRLSADPENPDLKQQLAAAQQRKLSLLRAALSEAVRRAR
jgi:hypothetical protein